VVSWKRCSNSPSRVASAVPGGVLAGAELVALGLAGAEPVGVAVALPFAFALASAAAVSQVWSGRTTSWPV
jgi:hypothetical protein